MDAFKEAVSLLNRAQTVLEEGSAWDLWLWDDIEMFLNGPGQALLEQEPVGEVVEGLKPVEGLSMNESFMHSRMFLNGLQHNERERDGWSEENEGWFYDFVGALLDHMNVLTATEEGKDDDL